MSKNIGVISTVKNKSLSVWQRLGLCFLYFLAGILQTFDGLVGVISLGTMYSNFSLGLFFKVAKIEAGLISKIK